MTEKDKELKIYIEIEQLLDYIWDDNICGQYVAGAIEGYIYVKREMLKKENKK